MTDLFAGNHQYFLDSLFLYVRRTGHVGTGHIETGHDLSLREILYFCRKIWYADNT